MTCPSFLFSRYNAPHYFLVYLQKYVRILFPPNLKTIAVSLETEIRGSSLHKSKNSQNNHEQNTWWFYLLACLSESPFEKSNHLCSHPAVRCLHRGPSWSSDKVFHLYYLWILGVSLVVFEHFAWDFHSLHVCAPISKLSSQLWGSRSTMTVWLSLKNGDVN